MKLVKLKNVKNHDDVIAWLIKMLLESESSFSPLREVINHPNKHFHILKDGETLLPAYIFATGGEAEVLWVHESCRKRGYAKFMITFMNIKTAIVAPSSIPFWESVGFSRVSSRVSSRPIRMIKK